MEDDGNYDGPIHGREDEDLGNERDFDAIILAEIHAEQLYRGID